MKVIVTGIVGLILGAVIGLYVLPPSGGDAPAVEVVAADGPAPVRWKMASSFPGELVQLGTLGKRFEQRIQTATNDSLRIKFYEPGALVPALEIFDAVSSGALSVMGRWAAMPLASMRSASAWFASCSRSAPSTP